MLTPRGKWGQKGIFGKKQQHLLQGKRKQRNKLEGQELAARNLPCNTHNMSTRPCKELTLEAIKKMLSFSRGSKPNQNMKPARPSCKTIIFLVRRDWGCSYTYPEMIYLQINYIAIIKHIDLTKMFIHNITRAMLVKLNLNDPLAFKMPFES